MSGLCIIQMRVREKESTKGKKLENARVLTVLLFQILSFISPNKMFSLGWIWLHLSERLKNHTVLQQGSAGSSLQTNASLTPALLIKIFFQHSHSFVGLLSTAASAL